MSFFRSLITLLMLFYGLSCRPQGLFDNEDSLSTNGDSVTVIALLQQAQGYLNDQKDSAEILINKALLQSEKIQWKVGMARVNAEAGILKAKKGQYPEAIHLYSKALRLYEELQDEDGQASVMANLSIVYKALGDHAKALDYAFRALSREAHLDSGKIAIINENIGTLYLERKEYEKTLQYYSRAMEVYKSMGNEAGVARNLGNTGIVYDANGEYKKALNAHLTALSINRDLSNPGGIQINLANIGYVYNHLKEYKKALKYQEEALEMSRKAEDKASIAINLGNIGETWYAIGTDTAHAEKKGFTRGTAIKNAIANLEKAVVICREINFAGPRLEFTEYLSKAYLLNDNLNKAMQMFEEHKELQKAVFSDESRLAIANLEAQRELDLKERDLIIKNRELEIARLKASNIRTERILLITGILLLALLVAFLIWRYLQRIRAHKRTLTDISQVQSHEVRAPVARILGLTQMFENKTTPEENDQLIRYIKESAVELDNVIHRIVEKTVTDRS